MDKSDDSKLCYEKALELAHDVEAKNYIVAMKSFGNYNFIL